MPQEEASEIADDGKSGLNPPKLDSSTGKPTQRAVENFKQAHNIAKRTYDRAKEARIASAAVIASKYGGDAPYDASALKATGEDWRNNYSTNPLASIVDRAKPQLVDPIKTTDSLTYSQLPEGRKDAAGKTRKFRDRTTKLIRSQKWWTDFIDQIAQEDYLFGNCAPGWIDDDWRPCFFRYDEVFLPEGSGQYSGGLQFVVFRKPIMLHDFLRKIEDKETAIAAGYDWEGCVKAANTAMGIREGGDESALQRVDAVREQGVIGFSHENETRVIWTYYLLVREYTGGVNLWVVTQNEGTPIRSVKGIHDKMEDAVSLFTLQTGNGKYYGSKGAGRLLANLHIAIDRNRCHANDQLYLSGMPILVVPEAQMNSLLPAVRTPFLAVPQGTEVTKETVVFDSQSFQYMDNSLVAIMESIAGAFIPPKIDSGGSPTTKIEAAQKAERELAVRNGVLGRFFGQFGELISAMQRKIYKPDNLKEAIRIQEERKDRLNDGVQTISREVAEWIKDIQTGDDNSIAPEEPSAIADSEAVEAIIDLLNDGLSIQDIAELALSPAGNNVAQSTEEQDQKTTAFIEAKQGNPYYNQRKMAELEAKIQLGGDLADQIVNKDHADPNEQAIAIRDQNSEWLNMLNGEQSPVPSTDNHTLHRMVLLPKLTPVLQSLEQSPTQEMLQLAQNGVTHYSDHLNQDQQATEEQKAQEHQGLDGWVQVINTAGKTLEQMAQKAAQAGVQGGAEAVPAPINGAPQGQEAPPANDPNNPSYDLDKDRLQAETIQRGQQLQLDSRKLDLEERKQKHVEDQAQFKAVTDTMQKVADTAAEAQKQGMADAENDLREKTGSGSEAPQI